MFAQEWLPPVRYVPADWVGLGEGLEGRMFFLQRKWGAKESGPQNHSPQDEHIQGPLGLHHKSLQHCRDLTVVNS